MSWVLVKYKNIKLLVEDNLDTNSLIENLKEIEILNFKFKEICENMLLQSKGDIFRFNQQKDLLLRRIGGAVIGAPFTTHDAELYALGKGLIYTEIELQEPQEEKKAVITFNLPQSLKNKIVHSANSRKMSLQAFMLDLIKKNL